jgi:hypothetical protein
MNTILAINAHLKYVEYLLHVFDTYPDATTLKTIREEFEKQFSTRHILLNQNFGIYRLLPLILIKEEHKKDRKDLVGVIEQIKCIRDSIAHNSFSIDENGYHFSSGKKSLTLTFDDFAKLLHKVENDFYEEKLRTKKVTANNTINADSDEHFAYIAGYTEGGAPYGVTWEEMEAAERSEAARRSCDPPAQKAPVSLNDVAQEMQGMFDTMTAYFKRSTGEFITITDEHIHIADAGDSIEDRPEWEQEAIRQTAEVLAREDDGDYVQLPSRYDIHEYSIMERFCSTISKPKVADDLFRSISGKGAFRRFKTAIRRHGIEDAWYRFKDEAYKEIAREWCEENGLTWRE